MDRAELKSDKKKNEISCSGKGRRGNAGGAEEEKNILSDIRLVLTWLSSEKKLNS